MADRWLLEFLLLLTKFTVYRPIVSIILHTFRRMPFLTINYRNTFVRAERKAIINSTYIYSFRIYHIFIRFRAVATT